MKAVTRAWAGFAVAILVIAIAIAAPTPASNDAEDLGSALRLPTTVMPRSPPIDVHDYPSFDRNGEPAGNVSWRVVQNTGNCCENYLSVTSSGRLVDIGGTYPSFTDDEGKNWFEVRPSITPLLVGEGAAVTAPNGDILMIEWDPYTGDHLVSFKYDSADDDWYYQEIPVHQPFFDRPWISLMPGPLTIAGETVPYVAIAKGGYPWKEVYLLSFDGLNYFVPSSKNLQSLLGPNTTDWLVEPARPWADWVQPHTESGITPLPSKGALSKLDYASPAGWFRLGPDLQWGRFNTPEGLGGERLLVDSNGALHRLVKENITVLDYGVSLDGGASWSNITLPLPVDHHIEDIDFKVNAGIGFAAIAVHAHNREEEVDQDLVFKIDVTGPAPILQRMYFVGDGDVNAGSGLGGSNRFDFTTLAILPSGNIAVSFIDQKHGDPSVAIQL